MFKFLSKWILSGVTEEDKKRITPRFCMLATVYSSLVILGNVIAGKVWIWNAIGFTFPAALIVYPAVFILSDIMTEQYNFRLSLIPVKMNLIINILMNILFLIAIYLPPAPFWGNQEAFSIVLGSSIRVTICSVIAAFFGDYINSLSLTIMKTKMKGKYFTFRSITSSMLGQLSDTGLFIFGAFYGTIPTNAVLWMIFSQYTAKILYQCIAAPLTAKYVRRLKAEEGEYFDKIEGWKVK